MSTINNDIPFVPENTTDPAAGLNQALNVIDALLQIAVLGIQNAPPGSPSEGDRYIVSPTGTAEWAGHDNQLARWQDGAWQFYDPRIAVNLGDSRIYSFDGTAWTDPAGGGVTALQPGDNVSELVNDAGYITSASVITDHGALSGLGDDDHPQYYNETRGDARYVQNSALGAASGVATLDASGKLLTGQLPALAITDTFVVASQAEMLALSAAEQGDVAVRADENKSYILAGTDPSVLGDWQELLTPTSAVTSVNGQVGSVVLNADDIEDTSTAHKFISSAELTKLSGIETGAQVNTVNPGDNVSIFANDAGYITSSSVVTDHGALTGLGDDDHTQYYNQARGDDRYAQRSNNLSDLVSASTARTNLGLGTAATANVTISETDATADRLLKVGDYGLGRSSSGLGLPNFNSYVRPGFYSGPGGTAGNNYPGNTAYGVVWANIRNNVSYKLAGYVNTDGTQNQLFYGRDDLPPVEIYHTGNLGAGTPSKGDILVHNGTNYVRLPVGTNGQVLTANSATASGVEWV